MTSYLKDQNVVYLTNIGFPCDQFIAPEELRKRTKLFRPFFSIIAFKRIRNYTFDPLNQEYNFK